VLVKNADLKDKTLMTDEDKARRDFDRERKRVLKQYIKKVKNPYIDLDPKVRVLEFTPEDIMPTGSRDGRSSMTTSRSQQPSASGTTSQITGQQISGQSISELRESSRQSISGTLSVSGMLKAESELSLRDESQQGGDELPEDLLKPLKILERLLGQSNYHKQQVLYKDYPFTAVKKPQEGKGNEPRE